MGGRKQRDRDVRQLGYSPPEERPSFFAGIGELAGTFVAEVLVLVVGLAIVWGLPGC